MEPRCAGCGKEPGRGHETYCKYLTGEEPIEYTTLGGNRCPFCGVTKGSPHKDGCQELHRPAPRIPEIVMKAENQELHRPPPKKVQEQFFSTLEMKDFAIDPIKFILANNLSFIQGVVIEGICNYNRPEGKGQEALYEIINSIKSFIESREAIEARNVKV